MFVINKVKSGNIKNILITPTLTKRHTHVDGLSRLPAPQNESCDDDIEEVFYTSQIDQLPVTERERVLSRVLSYVENGWDEKLNDPLLKGYFSRRSVITIHHGRLMWDNRVVIPTKLRSNILDIVHSGHPGIVKMKGLARSYIW